MWRLELFFAFHSIWKRTTRTGRPVSRPVGPVRTLFWTSASVRLRWHKKGQLRPQTNPLIGQVEEALDLEVDHAEVLSGIGDHLGREIRAGAHHPALAQITGHLGRDRSRSPRTPFPGWDLAGKPVERIRSKGLRSNSFTFWSVIIAGGPDCKHCGCCLRYS